MFTRTLLLGLVASLFATSAAYAESTANTTGTATTRVVAAIGITTPGGESIDFGDAARGGSATVIAPAAAASQTFNVTGEAAKVFTITVPAGTVNIANGANTIAVGSFTSSAPTGTLSGGGTASFTVGATLPALPVGQAVGTYTGSYTVTVAYQ